MKKPHKTTIYRLLSCAIVFAWSIRFIADYAELLASF